MSESSEVPLSAPSAESSVPARGNSWFAWILVLAPGIAFMAAFGWRTSFGLAGSRQFTLFDDAMISMSYGRTLAESGELVWYHGAPRVQGFTNPLWTLLMALLHALGAKDSQAALAVMLLGAAIVVLVSRNVAQIVELVGTGAADVRIRALAAAGCTALSYPLVFWSLRGMEVGLLALLTTLLVKYSLLSTLREPGGWRGTLIGRGVLVAAVGVLTRLDFLTLVIPLAGAHAFIHRRSRGARWWASWLAAAAFGATLLVMIAQRVYYGAWLPNTYGLKVSGVPLLSRVERGLVTSAKAVPVVVLVVAANWPLRSNEKRVTTVLTSLSLVALSMTIGYSVWTGGDAWERPVMLNRFIAPSLPLAVAAVLASATIDPPGRPGRSPKRFLYAAILLISFAATGLDSNPHRFVPVYALPGFVLAFTVLVLLLAFKSTIHRPAPSSIRRIAMTGLTSCVLIGAMGAYPMISWFKNGALLSSADQQMTEASIALATATSDGAEIATVWAGAPSYYSRRSMIDLLGKNDPLIASTDPKRDDFFPGHNKWDYEWSIGRLRPDVVFQPWLTGELEQALLRWGYVERCLGTPTEATTSWFLQTSQHVKWDRLVVCGVKD